MSIQFLKGWKDVRIVVLAAGIIAACCCGVLAQVSKPRTLNPPEKKGAEKQGSQKQGSKGIVTDLMGEVKQGPALKKSIVITKTTEPLEDRLAREITLDVREMNMMDVLKFLAMKGDFNLVTSNQVQGRVTLYLKTVRIKDALDLVVISNNLAYVIENDIVRILTGQEYELLYGKPFNDKLEVEILSLKYAKPSYVLSTLESLKSSLGRIIIDENTGSVVLIDTPDSIAEMKEAVAGMETSLETFVYTLQYAKADEIVGKLKARIEDFSVGSVSIDERTNKLIVQAYPARRKEIETIITSLDVPTKEVLVQARILQVVFKPEMDVGIDWQLDFAGTNMDFSNVFLGENDLSSSAKLYAKYGRIGIGSLDPDNIELKIRALKYVSDTKILSNPKILVTNNEEAKIHVGDTVPYIISTTSGTGENAITSEDVRFVDVGLKLNVIPTISENGMIMLSLRPEISTVVGSISSEGGGIPQVNKTSVETTVMVQDGMTVVLGGLKKDNKVQATHGIPFLMDIPFFGRFFGSDSESIESTEIVIFITPHVITGMEDEYDQYRASVKEHMGFDDGKEPKRIGIKE